MSESESNAALLLSLDTFDVLALSIPVDEFQNYADKPLKWLRYLGFAIAGQTGHLSTSSAGPEIDDYDMEIVARSYYFILDGMWKHHVSQQSRVFLT